MSDIANCIKKLKVEFFSYRNGVIASSLRSSGDTHKYIMGCMLPDIVKITSDICPDIDLACSLWAEEDHRECRIAAILLFPVDAINYEIALEWCYGIENREIADIICLKLLRNTSFANELWHKLLQDDRTLMQYTGLRLLVNLIDIGQVQLDDKIKSELTEFSHRSTSGLSHFASSIIIEE